MNPTPLLFLRQPHVRKFDMVKRAPWPVSSVVAVVIGLCLLLPVPVHAIAIADSTLSASKLLLTPAEGTLEFLDSWTSSAFASALNSLGETVARTHSSLGEAVTADAMVTFATAHGQASAPDLTAEADSHGFIPDGMIAFASSTGRGTLSNTFRITGGTGAVGVEVSLDVTGLLHGFADALGDFETEVVASLEVNGSPTLFHRTLLTGGPNFPDTTTPVSRHLSSTLSLQFDTPYFLFAEVDSESTVTNLPEPGPAILLLTGIGLLTGLARRKQYVTPPDARQM